MKILRFLSCCYVIAIGCSCGSIDNEHASDWFNHRSNDSKRIQVLAAVFRSVATEVATGTTLFLDLPKVDYLAIKSNLSGSDVAEHLAHENTTPSSNFNGPVIGLRSVRIRRSMAEARVYIKTHGHFADHLFRLAKSDGKWIVVSREFICAS